MLPVLLTLLAQAGSTTIVDPQSQTQKVTTTKSGGKVYLDVECLNCTGGGTGGGSPSPGGTVDQGKSNDGGYEWHVRAATLPLPTGASTEATLALIKAKTDNIDVALSTRTKPADQQHVVVDTAPTLTDTQLRAVPVPVSGTVTANAGTGPWPVTDNGGSLTVDGTVTANQGGAPWSVNQTQWNGVGVSVGSGASNTGTLRAILATDQPVIPVSDNGGSLTVDGTVAVSSVGGTVAVTQSTSPWVVGDGTGPLTVDGTVTANIGTTNGLSLDATLTGGTQKAVTRGGAKGATAAADMTSTAEGADHQALDVQIMHGGSAINPTAIRALTSADTVSVTDGSGPLTVDGTVAATQSGTWSSRTQDGAGNALASATSAPGGTEQALIVRNIPSGTQAVSGTVTANTSATGVASATTPAQCTTVGATSTTVLASQAGRKKWAVKASPANTVNCFFRMGATAVVTDMPLEPTAAFSDDGVNVYTGVVDAICAGAAQSICALSL